jgi:nucleotide-binding universal stress UspA family protein
MSGRATDEPGVRRILVALDAAAHDPALLDAAAALAARLGAELIGLFIEDLDLLRSAELPFVRQVSFLTACAEELDAPTTERELRVMAERAERRLTAAAHQNQVKCSFRVVRGNVARELSAAAEEADLVIVEESARPLSRHLRVPAPCRDATLQVSRSVLLYRRGAETEGPICAIYDGSPEGDQALAMAAKLTADGGQGLEVLLVPSPVARGADLEHRARQRLGGHGGEVHLRALGPAALPQIGRVLRDMGAGLVVLHGSCAAARGVEIEGLIKDLRCPVLLLR